MKRGNEKLRRRRRQLVQSLAWFIPVCMIFLGVIVSLSSSSSFLKHYNVVYDDNDNPSIEGQQPDREHDLNHEDAEIGAGNITEFDVSKGIVTTKETTSTVTATTTHQDISSVTTSTITVPRDTTTPNRNDGSRNEVVVVENGSNEDKSKIGDDEEFFGACLLVMDDNHYLVEWLAYHYYFLPLRRLIVGVDPKSKTSPKHILSRYSSRGLMNITVWNDDDYFHHHKPKSRSSTFVYIRRQEQFNLSCLRTIQYERQREASRMANTKKQSKPIWVALIDTDEYITVNNDAQRKVEMPRVVTGQPKMPTLYSMLTNPQNLNLNDRTSTPCLPMFRLQMATTEQLVQHEYDGAPTFHTIEEEVQRFVPSMSDNNSTGTNNKNMVLWNGTDFMTLRYRYTRNPAESKLHLKSKHIVDISRIKTIDIGYDSGNGNPHRPIRFTARRRHESRPSQNSGNWNFQYEESNDVCPKRNAYQRYSTSPYIVLHYPGTYEQFSYRNAYDERNVRSRARYDEHKYTYEYYPTAVEEDAHGDGGDETHTMPNIRSWLQPFVEQVGIEVAQELLQGVGQIEI